MNIICQTLVDSTFDVWSGSYVSECDNMALLCCVALSGFHGGAEYTWHCQDEETDDKTR